MDKLADSSPCLQAMGYSPGFDPVGATVPTTQGILLSHAPSSGIDRNLLLITSSTFLTI